MSGTAEVFRDEDLALGARAARVLELQGLGFTI